MPIKAVIWDMGGVILQMGDETARLALSQHYSIPLEEIYWAIFDSPSAKQAGVGQIAIQEHWRNVASHLSIPLEEMAEFQRQFWSADTIDIQLVDYIRALRQAYKTGMLSNAWDDLRPVIENQWRISDAFEDIIISAEVGLAKPDPRIYQLAIERLGVLPDEAVFFDDVLENVQAARQVGLRAAQFENREQAIQELEQILAAEGQALP
jgi:epoxide hydrolase-like predicted phosphatase